MNHLREPTRNSVGCSSTDQQGDKGRKTRPAWGGFQPLSRRCENGTNQTPWLQQDLLYHRSAFKSQSSFSLVLKGCPFGCAPASSVRPLLAGFCRTALGVFRFDVRGDSSVRLAAAVVGVNSACRPGRWRAMVETPARLQRFGFRNLSNHRGRRPLAR